MLRGGRGQVVLVAVALAGLAGSPRRSGRTPSAASSTERVTPTSCRGRSAAQTAMIEPGAAGARRPASKTTRVKMPVMPPRDGGEDQHRLHQHVREVDLVDAAEELDDRRAGGGGLGQALAEERCRRAGGRGPGRGWPRAGTGWTCPAAAACWMPSGVRTPWLMALFRNSTLAGSMKMLVSGSRPWSTRKSTPLPAPSLNAFDDRADAEEADDGQQRAQDAGGEVVDQHLEAGLDLAVPDAVELLHDPARRAGP